MWNLDSKQSPVKNQPSIFQKLQISFKWKYWESLHATWIEYKFLNLIQIQWMEFKFNGRNMDCKLVHKILKKFLTLCC